MILEVSNILVSSDIITEQFCCDLDKCHGICCVEGDAGAPVTLDEIAGIEDSLDTVWGDMSASAQAVVDKQGVAYTDREGDLVTSIVGGKDCVFTCYENGCCLCALERAYRLGKTSFIKPISCALYPIREKRILNLLAEESLSILFSNSASDIRLSLCCCKVKPSHIVSESKFSNTVEVAVELSSLAIAS